MSKFTTTVRRSLAALGVAVSLPAVAVAGAGVASAGTYDDHVVAVYASGTDTFAYGFGDAYSEATSNARYYAGSNSAKVLVSTTDGCVAVNATDSYIGWFAHESKGWAVQGAANQAGPNSQNMIWACAGNYTN